VATLSRAQSASPLPFEWNEAVHALAEKVAPKLGSSHTFAIEVKDVSGSHVEPPTAGTLEVSGSAPVDLKSLARALGDQIASMGGRQVESASAEFKLQVTVSQDVNRYLLVAEMSSSGETQRSVVVVPVANTEKIAGPPVAAPMLERTVVWRQPQPLLDFARADADATHTLWYILQPERIEVYELSGGLRILHDGKTLGRAFASRDPRGRIILSDAMHVITYLAGMQCDGAWNPTFNVQCVQIPEQQWPMSGVNWLFESPRNYFSGTMIFANGLERKFPAFYSAVSRSAATGSASNSRWIVAAVDGEAQLFEGAADPAATFAGWGSDIVTMAPACGLEWLVLASGTGDLTKLDRLQLYEINGQRAVAVGQSLEMRGPVLTLWPESDGKSARVVVRSLETGEYEASIVRVACGN
jgi:hypothetical protein